MAACRAVVLSGSAARVASGAGRGGALSWAGGAEGPGGAERDRWLGACSGLRKALPRSALARPGFWAGARPCRSAREGGVLNARGTVGPRRAASFRDVEPRAEAEREGRRGPTWERETSPGRGSEVHHQPPSRCLPPLACP